MTSVLVCIPTLTGREEYLKNCLQGYDDNTPVDLHISLVRDAPSAGVGWNRAVEQGLKDNPNPDYIHFTNDDVVPGENWFWPLAGAARWGHIPAPRIEPAGVHLGHPMPSPIPMPPAGDPTSPNGFFYADLPENQPTKNWQSVDHGALPFCSLKQWREIGRFIPLHFGTDKWFYHRAKLLGYSVVACQSAVIYNYAAQEGRSKDEWTEQDFLDFDCVIAYPAYVSGELDPREYHPYRMTPGGLAMARAWREETFG